MASENMGMKKALGIQFVSKYASFAVQLVLSAILARLLSAEEYGLLAIVTVFASFFQNLSDLGISHAIVQFKDLDDDDLSSLFTFSALLAVVLMLVFCALSGLIAWFYEDDRLIGLCCYMSLGTFFNTLSMVPNGVLLRDRRFSSIGLRLIFATVVAGMIAVALAFAGFGVYALATNTILSSAIVFFWNVFTTEIHLGNIHFMAPLRRVFSYSAYQAAFCIVTYFSGNLDNLLVGKLMGTTQLGYYSKAYNLTTYPVSYLAGIIDGVLHPYLVEYKDGLDRQYIYWTKIAKQLSLIAAGIAAVFFCCSKEIIGIVFGSRWSNSAILLQILSMSLYFQIMNNPTGALFLSAGHTDYEFQHSLVATGMTLIGLVAGLASGSIVGVAVGVGIAYCLHTASIAYFLIHKTYHKQISSYLAFFVPEVITANVTCALVSVASPIFSSNPILSLTEKFGVIFVCFLLGYAATGQLKHLLALIGR